MKIPALFVRAVASSFVGLLFAISAGAGETISNDGLSARWETYSFAARRSAPGVPLKPLGLFLDEACTQPATADGDLVAALRDEQTGHGRTLKQADPTKRATLRFVDDRPLLRFDGVDDHYLIDMPVSLTKLDYWVRYRINKAAPQANTAILSGLAPPGLNFTGPNGFRLQTQDYERSTAQNIMQTVHVSARAKRFKMSVDGLPIAEGDCFDGTSTKLGLGAQLVPHPSGFTAMDLEAVILGSDLSAERQAEIDRLLGTRLDAPRIVCVGDSITDGTHGGYGLTATEEYPSQLQLLLPQTFVVNSGRWGAPVGGMPPVDQLFAPGAKLIVFVGTNDLAGKRTAEATYADLAAYCTARRKLGWEVYVGTTLPRSSGPPTNVPADFEAQRQTLNKKLRDGFASFATGLVDFGADPRIGEPGDEKDTTYYNKDEVHTTAAGAKVLAALVFQALSREARAADDKNGGEDENEQDKDDDEAANRPFLAPLFSDNGVLQRDRAVPIWGWTRAGGSVTVALGNEKFSTLADPTGRWMTKLPAQRAGGPHALTVTGTGPDERVTLNNVLFGDLWICSGQSNMEWTVALARDGKTEVAAADFPQIRLLSIPNATAITPQATFDGKWQVCAPKTVAEFSAVGYFFGRKLHQETNVPIGLIDSSFGGTNAEAWLSADALRTMPDFQERVEAIDAQAKGTDRYDERMAAWWTENDPGTQAKWNLPTTSDAAWKTWKLPRLFDYPDGPYPQFDGIVWFRREIEVPASWAGKDLKLGLGTVDDRGTIFWNGEIIGTTNVHNVARVHTVPGRMVKAGRNLIALRVVDGGGGGGLGGLESDMKLTAPGEPPLSLAGTWRCLASAPMEKLPKPPQQFRGYHTTVTGLYNAMIAPLTPAAIKGAIWYQGENNNGRGAQYQILLPKLIADWRSRFSAGDFPFYIVQLANFEAQDKAPRFSGWTQIQEAHRLVSERVPNSGLAVINDVGEAGDIHPTNKQDVGLRLALLALSKDYRKQLEYSGPTLKSHTIEGSTIVLRFDHAEGGLAMRGDAARVFAICGEDRKFVWANAVVKGDVVTVSSPEVAKPIAVRFAWSSNPSAWLYNGAGLPASLFRTDDFEK